MGCPFQSFDQLDRDRKDRELGTSPRTAFLFLLFSLFMLGMSAEAILYKLVHLHRFDPWGLLPFAPLVLIAFRYSKALFRRLG